MGEKNGALVLIGVCAYDLVGDRRRPWEGEVVVLEVLGRSHLT